MTEQNTKWNPPEYRAISRPGHQNWGQMIGIGIVILGMLVMVVNLSLYKAALLPTEGRLFRVLVLTFDHRSPLLPLETA